jgi:5-oxoprolinase (ATP-hydrolysing)
MRIHWHFLSPGSISLHDDRWLSKPWGVLGGSPGARSHKTLVRYSAAKEGEDPPRVVCGSKQDRIKVEQGDVLEWVTWGGGGWGDPLQREAGLVAREVARGLVSRRGAGRYGVVLREDGSVDSGETEKLRGEMRKGGGNAGEGEGEGEVFNRGGTWEELKARCLEETGLPPPKSPRELQFRGPMTGLPYFKEWQKSQGLQT